MNLTRNERLYKSLEQVERALDRNYSRQPRFEQNPSPDAFFASVLKWVNESEDEEPDYVADSRKRDKWLAKFWQREPHWGGVLSSVNSIDMNRGWHLTGGRNQVARFLPILRQAEDGAGWRQYISLQSTSYYTTDMGGITETGRDHPEGPLRALYHVDPTKCRLTGDREGPLQYNNQKELWTEDDFFRLSSMRSILDEYNGLGYCATSRVLDMAKIMLAVYNHQLEQLLVRAPKGLLLLQNISQTQWNEAMKARDAAMDSDMRRYYNAVAVIAQEGVDSVDAKLVALSTLPDGFNLEVFTNLLMYTYALCIGYDPIEFWPVLAGQLGRGRETDIQHRKGTGKGGLNFMLAYQDQLQRELPETLLFEFEQRDQEGVLLDAQVTQAWMNVAKSAYDGEEPLLSREETRSLLVDQGVIPSSWTENEEEVQATDARNPETREIWKEQMLSRESVRRAVYQFPDEPIVRYSWPSGKTDIIWDRSQDALQRTKYTILKPTALIQSSDSRPEPEVSVEDPYEEEEIAIVLDRPTVDEQASDVGN